MSPVIDVKAEARKLASSKPVHAAAGAGLVASEALRDLPARLAKLRTDARVATLPRRATGYVMVVRTRATRSYDTLASRGKRVLNGKNGTSPKSSTASRNGAQGKRALDERSK
jgi:hypothetical protein